MTESEPRISSEAYESLMHVIKEAAVTDKFSCAVCDAVEGADHTEDCPIGKIEEWAHSHADPA